MSGGARAGRPGVRPADVAREALRAARREALRAEAEAEARGKRSQDPRTRRGTRAAGGTAAAVPRPATGPGPESAAARVKAAQEIRHYLANAFRMPTWSDTPEDEPPGTGTSGSDDSTPPAEPRPRTAPAEPDPTPVGSGPTRDEPVSPHTPPATLATPTEPHHTAPAQASPYLPATMATPHRDSELRRTFPEFAARAATAEGAPFAGTWWGNAWVAALEQGALDPKRLARGRGYAEQGHVDAITVTPGLVLAYVRGSRPRPYRVQVRVRTLEDADWARFLDAAADPSAARAGMATNSAASRAATTPSASERPRRPKR
ncbi:SWIM zinc finger family protein, partial [Streptomyces sp. NPDC003233]